MGKKTTAFVLRTEQKINSLFLDFWIIVRRRFFRRDYSRVFDRFGSKSETCAAVVWRWHQIAVSILCKETRVDNFSFLTLYFYSREKDEKFEYKMKLPVLRMKWGKERNVSEKNAKRYRNKVEKLNYKMVR